MPRRRRDDVGRPEPVGIGGILGELQARRGWQRRLAATAVLDRWDEVAGPLVAAHSEPVRVAGGVLVVRVEDSGWATQLQYLRATLRDRANAVLGEPVVRSVQVVVGALGIDHGGAPWRAEQGKRAVDDPGGEKPTW